MRQINKTPQIFYTTILTLAIIFSFGFHVHAQEESNEEVFTIVENMPVAFGCEKMKSEDDKQKCSTEAVINYVSENISYPEDAKNAGVEGIVYVSYIVNKEGNIDNVEVLRGIKDYKSMEEEAIRVVKSLPQYTPGTQRERKVNVRYALPIKFSL